MIKDLLIRGFTMMKIVRKSKIQEPVQDIFKFSKDEDIAQLVQSRLNPFKLSGYINYPKNDKTALNDL